MKTKCDYECDYERLFAEVEEWHQREHVYPATNLFKGVAYADEEIKHNIKTGKARLEFHEMALHGDDSDITELIASYFMRGAITEEEYKVFLAIKKAYPYDEDKE